MPILYVLYVVALAYVVAVACTLLVYGGLDHRRRPDRLNGVIEAGAGALVVLYLAAFHLEGLTEALPRELLHGGLVSTGYVVGPMVVGLVSTDYLLRRIIPLLSGVFRDEPGDGDAAGTVARSRRSVLGVTLGVVTASQLGSLTFLGDVVGSPTPETSEVSSFRLEASFEAPYFPTALSFSERGHGYLTTIEGRIFRFEPPSLDDESIQYTRVASGIAFPQGVEVVDDTLYTVDSGSAAGGKYGVEEGYGVLQDSNGTVVAFDVEPDGSLSNERTVVSGLPVVNGDHALHQIETGPDGRLYLSIGHLGGKKYPEMFDGNAYEPTDADHSNHEYLGTVISFEPDGSDVEIVAEGLRNVYDITFDRHGHLFGANNDGMSMRSKVWESLLHITDGADFGYPEYGTFDAAPPGEESTEPLWVLDGIQSTGVETTDELGARDGVVVALAGKVVFVPLERGADGVYVPEFLRPEPTVIELSDTPIIVEAGPEGYLWVGSTGSDDRLSLFSTGS